MPTVYPCVPGHEIVGRVTKIGSAVTKFKVGRPRRRRLHGRFRRHLPRVQQGLEQFCPNLTLTYNFPDKHTGGVTYGGYSDSIVVDRALRPARSPRTSTSPEPRLCSAPASRPIRRCTTGESPRAKRSAIVGLGGLGHMGVKFAHALGAHVVLFTTSPNKKEDALRLGADEVVISRNADEMAKHAGSFDFILDAVSADHDINAYINLLRRDGNLTLVGAPEKPFAVSVFQSDHGTPQPLRLAHRRHRGDAGDARLLRRAQHYRRCRSHSDPEGQRSLRATAEGRCEIPLLHRHGLTEERIVTTSKSFRDDNHFNPTSHPPTADEMSGSQCEELAKWATRLICPPVVTRSFTT